MASSDFPTADADIRALRITLLRALGDKPHPRMAIGSIAGQHNLTVDDAKSLVSNYGWPDPRDMTRQAFELEGRTPAAPQTPSSAQPTNAIERLLAAGEQSAKARTRKLAAKIREQLNDLRECVIAERKETEAAAADEAAQIRLKTEVAQLELELAQKKAQLKKPVKARPSTTPTGDAKTIRRWAADHGVACTAKGRVPLAVVEAYQLAMTQGVSE